MIQDQLVAENALQGAALMRDKISIPLTILLATLTFSSHASNVCNAEQQPPEGKNEKFDVNEHLKKFKNAYETSRLADFVSVGGGLKNRVAIMTIKFAPYMKYDLKHSSDPNMKSSEEFGNWFYGAAAAQMGFSEQQTLAAAAIVQQFQDAFKSSHPDYGDVEALATGIYTAITTGEGDAQDDIKPVKGGYSYSTDIFDKDPNADSNSNSCEQNDPNTDLGPTSGYESFGGGWDSSGSGIQFVGAGDCIGSCGGEWLTGTIVDWRPPTKEK